MAHDVFISYQTESLSFVESLCSLLENYDIKCWYGHRDIKFNHAKEIPDAIAASKVFLLVVDENVAKSPRNDILKEVYLAVKKFEKGKLDLLTANITTSEYENNELLYHIGRLQKQFLIENTLPEGATNLVAELLVKLGKGACHIADEHDEGLSHYKNDYFDISDEHERNRLAVQQHILKQFDSDVYEKLLAGRERLKVLDIGCNEGDLTMDRFRPGNEVDIVIGVDVNEEAVASAQSKYESDRVKFYTMNSEDADFICDLEEIMDELNVNKFDIIHISMLLLHLANPSKLLKRIRPLLAKNGKLFIRDIDDSLTFVAPDPIGGFGRMIKICAREELSGFRNSGKGIYSLLVQNGYKNVRLEKKGLDTSAMNSTEKDALFNTYFSFIYHDTKLLYQRDPNNIRIKSDYEWLTSNFDNLKRMYDQPDTLFQLGFITYTAEK